MIIPYNYADNRYNYEHNGYNYADNWYNYARNYAVTLSFLSHIGWSNIVFENLWFKYRF